MRKIFVMVLIPLFLSILCMPAFATESSALSFMETQSQSGDIVFTVSVSAKNVSAIAVTPTYDPEAFELIDGRWLLDGIVNDFSKEKGDGVIALAEAGDISSEVFTFTLRQKADAAEAKAVTCGVILLNTEETRIELTAEVQPTDEVCNKHIYGSYTANNSGHRRVCTKCGKVQLFEHTWDNGEITKTPTQTATGICAYTCSVCDYSKEVSVPALSGDDTTPSPGTGETEEKVPSATNDGSVLDGNGTQDTTSDKKPSEGLTLLPGNEAGWIVAAVAVILVSVLVIVLVLRKKRQS